MSDINYGALGGRIRSARKRAGLTQEKLSEICSVSTAHIGHIERGTRIPSLETLYRIACGLNISFDYLIIDSEISRENIFSGVERMLRGKDDGKIKTFMRVVKTLADNIDSL